MATRSVKLPDIGEGVAEAELVEWHVKLGDVVREDQILAAVMTDKATVEIPSAFDGTVVALGAEVGSIVAVGSELVRMEVGAPAAGAPTSDSELEIPHAPEPSEKESPATSAVTVPLAKKPTEALISVPAPPRREGGTSQSAIPQLPQSVGEKPIASPAVRLRAKEAGIDLRQVRGSGPFGRIKHEDVERFISAPVISAPVAARAADTSIEEIKVVGLRRRIAQRMAEAKRRVAHFSYVEEVDVTALEELRRALNAEAAEHAPKLTMIPFFILAIVKAVADFPGMNALYDDEAEIIRQYGAVHVGIAAQTPAGLMVPVVRHAETLDIWAAAGEIKRLSQAARDGSATREELTGSTITITSLGALGGIVSTPVINRPEVAIVGINKVAVRPVWQNNAFVPRSMMNLSSSFDHRVIDGYDAARFVQRIKTLLEIPTFLFVEHRHG